MASYINVQNRLVTCPYDEAHKVKESRLQLHIAKCRSNHLDKPKETCPFNATHVFDCSEKQYHLLNCPDRAPLDRKLAQSIDRNNPYKGRTAVPSYTESIPIVTDENWDDEISCQPRPGYKPLSEPPPGAIVEPPPMSKPSQRKKLYQELHRMHQEPNKPIEVVQKTPPHPPRQPNQLTEPLVLQNLQKRTVQDFHTLGLGRGRPNLGSSRIAANIFPTSFDTENTSDVPSYSAITNGMSQLGLGRGQSTINVENFNDDFPVLGLGRGTHRTPRNVGHLNDDDFPALGLGRGAHRTPKNVGMKHFDSRSSK